MNAPSLAEAPSAELAAVYRYHQLSKHHLEGYAAGPDTLDWEAQPSPFRHFEGSPRTSLPLAELPADAHWSGGRHSPSPLTLPSIAALLRFALGLTAWKQYGSQRWSLRANPSSGNLHPTEAYLLVNGVPGLADGLHHYDPFDHSLELRAERPAPVGHPPGCSIALTSIHWREAWKYGVRAWRYCQLDIGHAVAALEVSARGLGWQLRLEADGVEDALEQALGLRRPEFAEVEAETPALLLRLETGAHASPPLGETRRWFGQPSLLDPRPMYRWPEIDTIARATRPHHLQHADTTPGHALNTTGDVPLTELILRRRSAQAFAPDHQLPRAAFDALLAMLDGPAAPLPGANHHTLLVVHRVEGLMPGLYLLPAPDADTGRLHALLSRWPDWRALPGTASSPTLWQLKVANVQKAAATLCCQQRIAGDCDLLFGFLAEFDQPLASQGPAALRHMYWRAGALAHQLYLQATALDLAATGIGCFFDDAWHALLGIEGTPLQALYFLATGQPLHDPRVIGLSGYHHLSEREGGST